MYLKSIEMHGFKSFANKIVFDFHNGITGIVGPNGSGKSNVSDAVRWVLGEQSAKQLRGASMQDVIFAGTENRKPLSYAYVAITMDNSDHTLAVDYEEVTIARRVYRSGESEYLLNGSPCRLKDVNELFYDTGIGKEGYSIIGQGQIDRILSGKPEERRELFDEAVGIVKLKKRKAATIKKLDQERDDLLRVNDILRELERQVGPLAKQAENAKNYLKKKEELKTLDVNAFLLELDRLSNSLSELSKNYDVAASQLEDNTKLQEQLKEQFDNMQLELDAIDEVIASIKEQESNNTLTKGKLENQITLLNEQIKMAEQSDESMAARYGAIELEMDEHNEELSLRLEEKNKLTALLEEITARLEKEMTTFSALQAEIRKYNETIENDQKELLALLDAKATIKSKEQRLKTMQEQNAIQKSQLSSRLLARKTEEADLQSQFDVCQKSYDVAKAAFDELSLKNKESESKIDEWARKRKDVSTSIQEKNQLFIQKKSRLESLKNIAERYDGYGNSIQMVMDQKKQHPGIHGVIADLIHVEKTYEVAVETALGGNIQNIVTEDEATAKAMVSYLKENRGGRATFLPLTSVDGRGNFKKTECLSEKGVIGLCDELVSCDSKYDGVMAYLLGRVIVVDTIDNALSLAKKNHYSLHIVTLDGEYLSPGGSISGGRFKNNSNLLSRTRQLDQLEEEIANLEKEGSELQARLDEIETAISLLQEDLNEVSTKLQDKRLELNSAEIRMDSAKEQLEQRQKSYATLTQENEEIERAAIDLEAEKSQIAKQIEENNNREIFLQDEIKATQALLDEKTYLEESMSRSYSEVQIEEASARQKVNFADENVNRIQEALKKDNERLEALADEVKNAKANAEQKKLDIEEIKKTIAAADVNFAELEEKLKEALAKKEALNTEYRSFFEKREEIAKVIAALDKEIYRLEAQREKVENAIEHQNSYMWDEYELTEHGAMPLRDESLTDLAEMKHRIAEIKDEIRHMGSVNVNAIEEYKEVSERFEFLSTQRDDLVAAEETLLGIIEELDEGMRKQFTEGFADIQREFNLAFRELFGGGKGTLELEEGEDVLETGIKINAQPPGKKLQNMMQMSGGEKALTAIALLFAIQNLKPSPFCLLDEIEAALDDANVVRFAKYLNKLTKNTQFIIITHRRGTMNAADRLYGITMQEKGVSTLVSVNLIENDLEE